MKLDKFINRPVLSTVISILIVILGAIGLATLPITQYPDIAPPIRLITSHKLSAVNSAQQDKKRLQATSHTRSMLQYIIGSLLPAVRKSIL